MQVKNDRAKQFLRGYMHIKRSIQYIQEEIREYYASATRCTVQYSDTHGSGSMHDSMADNICRIVTARERLEDTERRLIEQLDAIEAAIDGMSDNTLRDLLYGRYIRGYSWDKIALDMHYDVRHVLRLHGMALQKITDYLDAQ